jgi:hypothetical protein
MPVPPVQPPELWQHLALAVACRIEFEQCCGRGALVDESAVVRFAAEYLQAKWDGPIRANVPHGNIPKKFVDVVGTRPRTNDLDLALEAKWAKSEGGTREWLVELVRDLYRLQHFTTHMVQGAARVLLVAGHHDKIREQLLTRKVHATSGGSVLALPHILPTAFASTVQKIQVRNTDTSMRKWLTKCHSTLGASLPSTYDARLVGHSRTGDTDSAVEVYVWATYRPKGWGSFNPNVEWKSP